MINGKLQLIKIHKYWLSKSKSDPYKRDDNNDVFYFLEGKMFYKNLKNTVYTSGMQICKRPLNKLYDSCIGGSNWIY